MTAVVISNNTEAITSTDALFRTWVQAIQGALNTVGLNVTTDTGQINSLTVTKPTVINTAAGYEIRKFQDTPQATAPIFLKIEYGTSTTGVGIPAIWLTIGTSTDGAGNLGGIFYARTITNGINSTVTINRYFCYKDGYFFFNQVVPSAATSQTTILIARSIDNAGVPTNKALFYLTSTSTNNPTIKNLIYGGGVIVTTYDSLSNGFNSTTLIPFFVTSVASGVDTQFFVHWMNGPPVCPVPSVLTIQLGAVAAYTPFSCTPLGSTSRTYLSLGTFGSPGYPNGGLNYHIAYQWD